MTNEELDILWFKAMRQSVEEDKAFIRYHFATLVAAAEREACAKVCKNEEATLLHKEGLALPQGNPMLLKMASVANFCAAAIRARGET